jgi:hypothetical protein
MNSALPQEMQQHTYAIMNRVEDSHWWFVGRRLILESFLKEIVQKLNNKNPKILMSGVERARTWRCWHNSANRKALMFPMTLWNFVRQKA